jgi:hypothetical protein
MSIEKVSIEKVSIEKMSFDKCHLNKFYSNPYHERMAFAKMLFDQTFLIKFHQNKHHQHKITIGQMPFLQMLLHPILLSQASPHINANQTATIVNCTALVCSNQFNLKMKIFKYQMPNDTPFNL